MIVMKDNKAAQQMFAKNKELLPGFLKQQLQNIRMEDVWEKINIIYNEKGYPVCRCRIGGEMLQLNSAEPLAQAEHWARQISFAKIRTLFVYGCGFGYPLYAVYKQMHQENIVVVFEQDIHLFTAMLHFFDMGPLLRTNKFIFFVGDYPDFAEDFRKFVAVNLYHITVPSVVFPPGLRPLQKKYFPIQERVFEKLVLQTKAIGNSHFDSILGFQHMIDNVQEVLENPYFSSLKNQFKDMPAFIVGNGPSLDKQLHELAAVKEKGLIICCGSAIVPLTKNGIQPDALCVLERSPGIYHHFFENKDYPEEMTLLALAVVDPRVFSSYSGPRIPVFRTESNSQFISEYIGDGNGVYAGSSVTHLAFEAAVYMGADPIVLVGQDLAYGSAGMTHSKDSLHKEEQLQHVVARIKSEPVVYVESNDGRLIPASQTWYSFKQILEQMIEQAPEVTVINTTEKGTKIDGTVTAGLKDVIQKYCRERLPNRLNTVISREKAALNMEERKAKLKHLLAMLNMYIEIYRGLEQLTVRRLDKCEALLDAIGTKGISAVKAEARHVYETNESEIAKFFSPQLHVTYFQQVILLARHQINGLGTSCSPVYLCEAIQIQYVLFDHLKTICQSLVRNFQIACGKLSAIEIKT
ncbi:Uncharacterized conserved protein [Evansella caseinilytica]|uniref:Uncharacterized conserved protein n=1 Tax=Evansella caseinilytica TaxID=1503961 RepID=A0A1H3HRT0_9BACI|nr:6-hydroxymethylpterin diphosphokinase MptE-like protein [Evansella caseinilytica]SDY18173.1 Uncharacterized conserved protein [Evansella caseinilytica]